MEVCLAFAAYGDFLRMDECGNFATSPIILLIVFTNIQCDFALLVKELKRLKLQVLCMSLILRGLINNYVLSKQSDVNCS